MESVNSRLRDELLNRELFLSLAEARVVLDLWRSEYNQQRPHGSLGRQTSAAFAAHLQAHPAGAFPAGPPAESLI
jgi:transposase InsO family protein